ncbi:MAG: acetate--CoA ligase family protein [Thermoplasmata archaeon]
MFQRLFNPSSIAVIGASKDEKKIGNVVLKNLKSMGYKGKVYPINPKEDTILDFKVYKSILDIDDKIDIAVITLSANQSIQAVKECVRKDVPFVIVIAGGFSETGEEGKKLEDELINAIRGTNTRIIGPNTVGIYIPRSNVSTALTLPERTSLPGDGNIGFISQSGALGLLTMDIISEYNLGVSGFINIGNRIDLSEIELMEYFLKDENTKSIALYLETFKDGRKFFEFAKEVSKIKPIVLLKGGRTEAGAKAASLHTGAIATNDSIVDGMAKQLGIVRAYTEIELFDYAKVLAYQKPLNGDRIAVVTTAGGVGVVTSDYLTSQVNGVGLKLAKLKEETKIKIKKSIVPFGSAENPIDLTADGSTEQYDHVLEYLNEDENVDGIIVYALYQTAKIDIDLIDVLEKYMKGKPMVVGIMGSKIGRRMLVEAEKRKIPAYPDIERTVKSMYALYLRGKYLGD